MDPIWRIVEWFRSPMSWRSPLCLDYVPECFWPRLARFSSKTQWCLCVSVDVTCISLLCICIHKYIHMYIYIYICMYILQVISSRLTSPCFVYFPPSKKRQKDSVFPRRSKFNLHPSHLKNLDHRENGGTLGLYSGHLLGISLLKGTFSGV